MSSIEEPAFEASPGIRQTVPRCEIRKLLPGDTACFEQRKVQRLTCSPTSRPLFPFSCQVDDLAVFEDVHRGAGLAADFPGSPCRPAQGRVRRQDIRVLRPMGL